MSDLRTDLDRLAERATAKSDAFERLERRRRRKERNRRIGAGVLALVLVVGGSVAAWTAFRDGAGRTVGDDGGETSIDVTGGFQALWPESTIDAFRITQAEVAAGEHAWRSDPTKVASRFAASVLGWSDPRLAGFAVEATGVDEGVIMDLRLCEETVCPSSSVAEVTATLAEMAPGIWSVVEVDGSSLHTGLPPGAIIEDGSELTLDVDALDGTEVQLGFEYGDGGCRSGQDAIEQVRGGVLIVPVELIGGGSCDDAGPGLGVPAKGLLSMAWMEPASASALGIFDVQPGGQPDVGYVVDLAAVPVTFVPPGTSGSGDDVVELTCDESGSIAPVEATVAAQPDGVHLRLIPADERVSFSVELPSGGAWGTNGGSEEVFPLPPGEVTVWCSIEDPSFGGVASPAALTVEDPGGFFVPTELGCLSVVGQIPEYAEGTAGSVGDPVQVVTDHVSGLEFDDTVERAGYPESEQPVVRVVRDGEVVARATLRNDSQGGWLLDTLENCDGMPFGWAEEVAGVTGPPAEPGDVFVALCTPEELDNSINVRDGSDLHVDGSGIDFDTDCLRAPGEEPITILFSNLDPGVQRNISLYVVAGCLADAVRQQAPPSCPPETLELPVFRGEVIEGASEIVYEVGVLESGVYYFQDDVHPQANGLLLVT